MPAPMLATESEYALRATRDANGRTDPYATARVLVSKVAELVPSLPGPRSNDTSDIFLVNGGRLYVDQGAKIELAQPECSSPEEVVRYILAGERLLSATIDELARTDGPGRVNATLHRCNVDYVSNQTWGCHENYLIKRTDSDVMATYLIPHLVSRIIYTGEGGWRPFSCGLEFSLSPRAGFFNQVMGSESTHDRPIFHTKDESLCGSGQRLHVICGANLCSHLATYLKLGTTALIATLISNGVSVAQGMRLLDPLEAIRTFAASPDGRVEAELVTGGTASAIDIQKSYLEFVERYADASFMPPWTMGVCRVWRSILERLESGPEAVSTTLDWAIKMHLYEDYLTDHGFAKDSIPDMGFVLDQLTLALRQSDCEEDKVPMRVILGEDSPIKDKADEMGRYLRGRNLTWNQIGSFISVRDQLREIDTRFGQLGNGIFEMMDKEGVLEHGVDRVTDVESARSQAPSTTRARVRSDVIRRMSGKHGTCICDWHCITVAKRSSMQQLDLTDPFESSEQWRKITDDEEGIDDIPAFGQRSALLLGVARARRRMRR